MTISNSPQRASRYPGLDLLRSLAILLVIMQHMPRVLFPEWFIGMKYSGWTGVDLFFVLSGYLIGSQLLRPYTREAQPSVPMFYLRRAMRVLPAYLVVVLLYFTIPVFRERPVIPPLWRFLTFTQNFGLDPTVTGAFSHAWSLCVEEHFYLLLPLIVLLLMWKPRFSRTCAFVVLLFLGGMALRLFLWSHYLKPNLEDNGLFIPLYWKELYYPTYTRLDGLLVGVVIAAVKTFRPDWWARITARGNMLLIAGVVLLSFTVWMCIPLYTFQTVLLGFPFLALAFGLLVIAALSPNSVLGKYRVPGANAMATLAYSTYLTHKEVMHLDWQYFGSMVNMSGWAGWCICLVTIPAAASLLYFCVERPFLKWRERIIFDSEKNTASTQAAVSATV
jgi:peptidoglycan/LPS O-acetylase OafA/YrhL